MNEHQTVSMLATVIGLIVVTSFVLSAVAIP
jgi:hypothetical protein